MVTDPVAALSQEFRNVKRLADAALARVPEVDLFATLDEESNSLAVLMKHLAGNMRSRFTDFLTSDGEKPDRRRDTEFVIAPGETKASLQARWEAGWRLLFDTLDAMSSEDLAKTVYIRGEPHSVVQAFQRQLSHYAYHTGQIVQLARHYAGKQWESLSIPRGESEQFNTTWRKRHAPDATA